MMASAAVVESISKIVKIRVYFCFFFSSRRRHTRFDCDWSSDVCSSDLVNRGTFRADREAEVEVGAERAAVDLDGEVAVGRSEERRVGKECRSRWSPYNEKKNGTARPMDAEVGSSSTDTDADQITTIRTR